MSHASGELQDLEAGYRVSQRQQLGTITTPPLLNAASDTEGSDLIACRSKRITA
jgi:hypothetical protein